MSKADAKGGRRSPKVSLEASPADLPTLISVGYGNLVAGARVVAIVGPGSAPMRRVREQAAGSGKLIDATEGRRTRSILFTDSDHVILSAINPETIASRIEPEREPGGRE